MEKVKQVFRLLIKNDYKSLEPYLTVKEGKKIIQPNKVLVELQKIAVVTTENVNKNFIKLVVKNTGEELYAEISINEFLKIIDNPDFRLVSKSTAIDLSLVRLRLQDLYLMYQGKNYKIGKTFLPSINAFYKEKYNI